MVFYMHKSDTTGTEALFLSLETTVKLFQLLARVAAVKMANLQHLPLHSQCKFCQFLLLWSATTSVALTQTQTLGEFFFLKQHFFWQAQYCHFLTCNVLIVQTFESWHHRTFCFRSDLMTFLSSGVSFFCNHVINRKLWLSFKVLHHHS